MPGNGAAAGAVETQADLDRAWVKHGLPRRAPTVDFERNFVLLLGQPDDACVDELIGLEVRRGRLHVEWLPPPGFCAQPLVFRIHAVQVDRRHVPATFDVAFEEPFEQDAERVTIQVSTREGPPPDEPSAPRSMTKHELAEVFQDHPVKRCEGEPEYLAVNGGGSDRAATASFADVRRWLRRRGYRENVDFSRSCHVGTACAPG